MDCFYLAFRVPNLLRDLFAEGALSQAFVTTFSKKLKAEGEASAWVLANKMMTLTVVFMSGITLLGLVAAPWIVELLTAFSRGGGVLRSYNPAEFALTVTMVRVMYPFPNWEVVAVPVPWTGTTTGVLSPAWATMEALRIARRIGIFMGGIF